MSTVLVVEDDRGIRELLHEVLTWEGYRVRTACHGPAGLALALAEPPDLVLADVLLPAGPSGADLARTLRADPATARVPIVLMSGQGQDRIGDAPREAFLAKPFDLDDLVATVARCLAVGVREGS